MRSQHDFDLVVSNWLLVYAHDRDELNIMCRGLAGRIRSGGRFVTLTTNPSLYSMKSNPPDYRKYGFEVQLAETVYEGVPLVFTVHLGGSSMSIENYYLPIDAHESALYDAGIRNIEFHEMILSPDPQSGEEGDYLEDFFKCPPAVMISGTKS